MAVEAVEAVDAAIGGGGGGGTGVFSGVREQHILGFEIAVDLVDGEGANLAFRSGLRPASERRRASELSSGGVGGLLLPLVHGVASVHVRHGCGDGAHVLEHLQRREGSGESAGRAEGAGAMSPQGLYPGRRAHAREIGRDRARSGEIGRDRRRSRTSSSE